MSQTEATAATDGVPGDASFARRFAALFALGLVGVSALAVTLG